MFERFTDRAREVLKLAERAAHERNHEYIGTEHVLIGLVTEASGVGANVLKNMDVDLKTVRDTVDKLIGTGPGPGMPGRLPQTPHAKQVVDHAVEQARSMNHNYVGTEHLLLGLVHQQDSVAGQVLVNLGLDLCDVRNEVLRTLGVEIDNEGVPSPSVVPSKKQWLTVTRKFFRDNADVQTLIKKYDDFRKQKEASIRDGAYERAAELRDNEEEVLVELSDLIDRIVAAGELKNRDDNSDG